MILATGDEVIAVLPLPNGGGDLLVFTKGGAVYRFSIEVDGITPRIIVISAAGAPVPTVT